MLLNVAIAGIVSVTSISIGGHKLDALSILTTKNKPDTSSSKVVEKVAPALAPAPVPAPTKPGPQLQTGRADRR